MTTEDPKHDEIAWERLCRDKGWCCRFCSSIPKVGEPFKDNVCEDCRLSMKNYGAAEQDFC